MILDEVLTCFESTVEDQKLLDSKARSFVVCYMIVS